MDHGKVHFEEIGSGEKGDVTLDGLVIATYERVKGKYRLTALDGKTLAEEPKRASLVAHVKNHAESISQPVEVTIKLPPRLARLIPDMQVLELPPEQRGDRTVPILFAMASNAVDAAGSKVRFSREVAISQAALSIVESGKQVIFEIVADALAKKP